MDMQRPFGLTSAIWNCGTLGKRRTRSEDQEVGDVIGTWKRFGLIELVIKWCSMLCCDVQTAL
jgi:hypothetical protein